MNKFGRVAFKDVNKLNTLCRQWKVNGEEEVEVKKECLTATAVASLFSWLNGQAHSLGKVSSVPFFYVLNCLSLAVSAAFFSS